MATGFSNRLIGQAGEFAVCAQLGKLGYIATPFAGNVPHFDILATDEMMRTVPIQVKTTFGNDTFLAGDATTWMSISFDEPTGKQTVSGPNALKHPELIHVYVWLSKEPDVPDRFFVLTKRELQTMLVTVYTEWLQKHGGIRPKKSDSYHLAFTLGQISQFENRWELIRERMKS